MVKIVFYAYVDMAAAMRARCSRWGPLGFELSDEMLRALTKAQVEQIIRVVTAPPDHRRIPVPDIDDGLAGRGGPFFRVSIDDGDASEAGFAGHLAVHIERTIANVADAEKRIAELGDGAVIDTDEPDTGGCYYKCYGVRFADLDAARTLYHFAWDSPVTQRMVRRAEEMVEAARLRRKGATLRANT